MLLRNRLSLESQSDRDYEQTLLIDTERRGVAWAVGNLSTVEATGEYVWILDDDDECVMSDFVAGLKKIVESHTSPDIVIVRMDHGEPLGVLPANGDWGCEPRHGGIGTSAFIVRRDIWNLYRSHWQACYHGDYLFVRHLWDCDLNFVFWDIVASRVQRALSGGAPE